MRHNKAGKKFNRTTLARKGLLRGLVKALVEHERIETTVTKAKELRRLVERAVTRAKDNSFNSARVLLAKYPDKPTVKKLLSDLGPRFKDRPGGYTRVIKLGPRDGDGAETAFIEFVDFDPSKKGAVFQEVDERLVALKAAKTKKKLRLMKSASRKLNRP